MILMIDYCRILFDHMQKLSKVVTPFHKDLRIPKIYHYECPWPAAQKQIYMINVYKACTVATCCRLSHVMQ